MLPYDPIAVNTMVKTPETGCPLPGKEDNPKQR